MILTEHKTISLSNATIAANVASNVLLSLAAAQSSLILQNVFVVICAAGVYAYLWFEWEITEVYGEWLIRICHAGIIIFGILANLASMARMIAVERDWIVEICGRDKDMLASRCAFPYCVCVSSGTGPVCTTR